MYPIKVLHLGMSINKGGIEKNALYMAKYLDSDKVQLDILCSTGNVAYEEELKNFKCDIYRVDFIPGIKGFIKNVKTYYNFFKSHKQYQIIHNNLMSYYHIEALIAQKLAKIPVRIIHAHGSSLSNNTVKTKIIHNINKYIAHFCANFYIACSDKAADFMFYENIVNSNQYAWIKNGVHIEKFKFNEKARLKIREKFNINDYTVYGHVGAFLPVKNHEFLFNVFREILGTDNKAMLVLVGDGFLKGHCYNLAVKLKIHNNVIFLGMIDNVDEILSALDVLIFPSVSEGLPNVIIESQASGLPCYVSTTITKQVHLTELVTEISLERSPAEWGKEILLNKVYSDRIHYAKEVEEKGFDIKRTVRELENLYLKWESNYD